MLETHIYRMSDNRAGATPAILVPSDALEDVIRKYNTPEAQFGLFQSVNVFRNGQRREEDLIKIAAWAADMDRGTKLLMRRNIDMLPVPPSMIVETARGFQPWWFALNGTSENWDAIVSRRIVPFLAADRNARDKCRILRMPGSLHLKDPAAPFYCRTIMFNGRLHTEERMLNSFPEYSEEKVERIVETGRGAGLPVFRAESPFWPTVRNLNCEEVLRRLSGTPYVNGETYSFLVKPNGNKNIIVNGESSSCWIDKAGRIGSRDKGGPTVVEWLKWFGRTPREIADIMKTIYPELKDLK